MDDLFVDGKLDFPAFQRLFLRALDVCDADTDDLEMLLASAREPRWRDWMLEEFARHRKSAWLNEVLRRETRDDSHRRFDDEALRRSGLLV